jgi:hypothetical protein
MVLPPPEQLLGTSWTAHRLSPLHHGRSSLLGNADVLETYAKRLRDLLAGDVLRGVQIALTANSASSDDALTKAGVLIDCRWETLPTWAYWGDNDGNLVNDSDVPMEKIMGILITLEYENITYRAALLVGPDGYRPRSIDKRRKQSTYLPLLLTRMPNALRQTFVQFLSTTFDTYCAVLRLSSGFLAAMLDLYMTSLTADEKNSAAISRSMLEAVVKETQLTLSFAPSIAPSLKALDINLPRETLSTFAVGSSTQAASGSRFLASLAQYLDKHLAMNVEFSHSWDPKTSTNGSNPHFWLSKVASGAFVLSADGRFKLVASPDRHASGGDDDNDDDARIGRLIQKANEAVLQALVRRAVGDDLPP